jgi:hypothetical protein
MASSSNSEEIVKEVCGLLLFCVFNLGDVGLIMVVWKLYPVKFLHANREANKNNNIHYYYSTSSENSPQVTCSVSPTCFLTPRDVATGIVLTSDLLCFVYQRPFLHSFTHFIRLWEINLCEVLCSHSTATEFSSHCVISISVSRRFERS